MWILITGGADRRFLSHIFPLRWNSFNMVVVRILLAIWRAQLSSPAEITNLCLTIVFARGLRVPPILGPVLGAARLAFMVMLNWS